MSSREWTPYIPTGTRTRVVAESCCGRYQLLQEGGAYVVTRSRPYSLSDQETARGPAVLAREVFDHLVALHLIATQTHQP